MSGEQGELRWTGDWISFLDTMLQISILGLPGQSLRLPTRIKSVRINPLSHVEKVYDISEEQQGQ